MIFTNARAKMQTRGPELIGWMQKKWNAFKISGFTETLAELVCADLRTSPGRYGSRTPQKADCQEDLRLRVNRTAAAAKATHEI